MSPAISWQLRRAATWFGISAIAAICACGGRRAPVAEPTPAAPEPRTLPLTRLFVLETTGPPPSDTSVGFVTGSPRTIVLYHSGESIAFARLSFAATAFGDSGRAVQIEVRPRPGQYGLDFTSSVPLQGGQASVTFVYGRYFSAPARARQVYGSDVAFERALAVGHVLPDGQVNLLPSSRPIADNVNASLPAAGSYIVGAPQ